MADILWYQPAKLSDDDALIKDGCRLAAGSAERSRAFNELEVEVKKWKSKKPSFCSPRGARFYVNGFFNEKDEVGRPLCFMFTSNRERKEASEKLREMAKAEGLTLHEETLAAIEKAERKCWTLLWLGVAVVIIVLILLIWKTRV